MSTSDKGSNSKSDLRSVTKYDPWLHVIIWTIMDVFEFNGEPFSHLRWALTWFRLLDPYGHTKLPFNQWPSKNEIYRPQRLSLRMVSIDSQVRKEREKSDIIWNKNGSSEMGYHQGYYLIVNMALLDGGVGRKCSDWSGENKSGKKVKGISSILDEEILFTIRVLSPKLPGKCSSPIIINKIWHDK